MTTQTHQTPNDPAYMLAAMYKFVSLPDYEALKTPLLAVCQSHGVCGSLLLAEEGLNGTIAGTREGLDAVLTFLRSDPRLADLNPKYAAHSDRPFKRMKVRLKKEIVTLGVPGVDPNTQVGTYVKPKDWNAMIRDPDVVVVDTRNDYEVQIGTFENAIDPQTKTFREFPDWVQKFKEKLAKNPKPKIAMFCTGGIRCEKASAYMLQEGFPEVYHLEGGILKYLEEVPHEDSAWTGECFVFDERVAVGHDLVVGDFSSCLACGRPLSPEDLRVPEYDPGVSCRHCIDETTQEQKDRFRERARQMGLSKTTSDRPYS